MRGRVRTLVGSHEPHRGFWSLFKRGSYRVYHKMAGERPHRYLCEFTRRAGTHGTDTMNQMECMARRKVGKTRTCKRLTA